MKKERLAILKMVDEGKITVDEAIKLLETIKKSNSVDAGEVLESVKERVGEIVDDAKPVVKKYANKAKEVSEDIYNKGKIKMSEYKSKTKNSDIIDDVIIESAENAADVVEDTEDNTID